MANYDIFNGDADGICALLQLRLAEPRKAKLITGVKRDINLLERVNAKQGDQLTVLDISMRTNQSGLGKALKAGANIFYVDHHNAGDIPQHENLFAVIDTRPTICTSLLINKCLDGVFVDWAIVGAFGDNLNKTATKMAQNKGYKQEHINQLQALGAMLNYNAYGRDISDLHFTPDKLFNLISQYESPDAFLFCEPEILKTLEQGYSDDLSSAWKAEELLYSEYGLDNDNISPIWLLDDAPWARRISGSFGNVLANNTPDQAHAILTHNYNNTYTISVRAPQTNPHGADTLCLKFPSGGGRSSAAGINNLPKDELKNFVSEFVMIFFNPSHRKPIHQFHFQGERIIES